MLSVTYHSVASDIPHPNSNPIDINCTQRVGVEEEEEQ